MPGYPEYWAQYYAEMRADPIAWRAHLDKQGNYRRTPEYRDKVRVYMRELMRKRREQNISR